ncbi:unnamed protein product [Thelazia callipaeda]|uniref:Phosphoserine phosphatase n=1 Tax=Thelazia callipaeda TaxID=103827 RepID=A0A0N5D8I0_THECL|nr:unnamed protein product [Thelazia callipaeda]
MESEEETEARRLWKKADAVCFDVDSTICMDESIDEFARYLLHYEEVREYTEQAVSGMLSFKKSLNIRLDILKPTRQQLQDFMENKTPKLTPGSKEIIADIHRRHIPYI